MTETQKVAPITAQNPIDLLAQKTGSKWVNIANARKFTQQRIEKLQESFNDLNTGDTSIVVFGSLARDEATSVKGRAKQGH